MAIKTPQLRVAVIPHCNLHCIYCTPEGEGYGENPQERMSVDEIIHLVQVCSDVGITHVKFTGGEPTLRTDIVDLVGRARAIRGIQEIQMVTNGTLLVKYASRLKAAGLDSITVSIDAADEASFQRIRGASLKLVMAGLEECRRVSLPIRINSVIMRSNVHQIIPLMGLARQAGASLKLLDLMDLRRPDVAVWWRDQFIRFDEVRNLIEKSGAVFVGYEEAPGGVGAPLLELRTSDGLQVVLKDATLGTFYNPDFCQPCPYFPCQDALISLRLTHDGHLKRCLVRNDNLVDILTPLRLGDTATVYDRTRECFRTLVDSHFFPKMWQPEVGDDQLGPSSASPLPILGG